MNEFTISGTKNGETFAIGWGDGMLSGPTVHTDAIIRIAQRSEDVGPVGGPYTYDNHLANALSAFILINDYFDTRSGHTGTLPDFPSDPELIY